MLLNLFPVFQRVCDIEHSSDKKANSSTGDGKGVSRLFSVFSKSLHSFWCKRYLTVFLDVETE